MSYTINIGGEYMQTSIYLNSMRKKLKIMNRRKALYFMMIPGVVFLFVFNYMPMYGAIIAFKDFAIKKGIMASPWANPWYKHFAQFFKSPYCVRVLKNTLIISVLKIVITTPITILFAVAMAEVPSKGYRKVVQTLTYLPHFLSWIIVYGVFFSMLSESRGLINYLIKQITGSTINFMSSTKWFRPLLIFSDLWKENGWNAIVYLAAIIGIDSTLYEAAKIDGCNRWQMIYHITLPGIRSVVVIMLLLKVSSILDAGFDQVYAMYSTQVLSVGDIIDTWVYRTGIKQWNMSLASAVGLFKSVIGTLLLVSLNALARRWGESLW